MWASRSFCVAVWAAVKQRGTFLKYSRLASGRAKIGFLPPAAVAVHASRLFSHFGAFGVLPSRLVFHNIGPQHAEPCSSAAVQLDQISTKLIHHSGTFTWRLRLVLRAVRLVATFAPLIVVYPLVSLHARSLRLWWLCVYTAAEISGPTVIKLFQWAATRRDLFSSSFCDLFSHFHRRTRVRRPWAATEKLLVDIFGPHWRQCFLRFEKEPIGAGCIAQVFKAEIVPSEFEAFTGTKLPEQFHSEAYVPVALKIAHPAVVEEICMDMELMGYGATLAQTLAPPLRYLDPVKCLHDFQNIMQKQVDLRHEGNALQRFSCNFSDQRTHIRFPVPLHVSSNILVETFEEGIPIGHFARADASGDAHLLPETRSLNRFLAHLGVTAICKMIFTDNFVHGDLHPGNILVQNCRTHRVDTHGNLCLAAREKVARTRRRVYTAGTRMQRLLRSLFSTGVPGMHVAHESLPASSAFEEEEHTMGSFFRFATGSQPETDLQASMPTLVLLDTGITVELSKKDLNNFRAVFMAAVKGDGRHIGQLLLEQAPDQKQWCTDREAFKRDINSILESSSEHGRLCLRKLDASKVLSDLLSVVSKHKVCLEPNFTSVILAVMVFEGLGRSLDPDIDILHSARPFLFSAAFG